MAGMFDLLKVQAAIDDEDRNDGVTCRREGVQHLARLCRAFNTDLDVVDATGGDRVDLRQDRRQLAHRQVADCRAERHATSLLAQRAHERANGRDRQATERTVARLLQIDEIGTALRGDTRLGDAADTDEHAHHDDPFFF